jgi:hypothetical protein
MMQLTYNQPASDSTFHSSLFTIVRVLGAVASSAGSKETRSSEEINSLFITELDAIIEEKQNGGHENDEIGKISIQNICHGVYQLSRLDNQSTLISVTVTINIRNRECKYTRTFKAGHTEEGSVDFLFPNENIIDALTRMFRKFDPPNQNINDKSSKCTIS